MTIEPFLEWPPRGGGALVPVRMPGGPDAPSAPMSRPMPDLAEDGPDPRHMSPRQFADWAHELYIEGVLGWHEYRVAGFPSELHPDFAATIGALTGERAEPDRPRDMLLEWERRLSFDRRHNGRDSVEAARSGRILDLLRRQAEACVRSAGETAAPTG